MSRGMPPNMTAPKSVVGGDASLMDAGGSSLSASGRLRDRHAGHDAVLGLEPLERGDPDRAAHVVLLGAVTGAVLDQLAAGHQALAVDDQLGARRADEVVLAAHDDRFLGAGVDAEAAVDAAQEVDLEAGRVLLDRLLRPLPGLDVDALGGADGGAHVARHALRRPVEPLGEDVDAAVARGVGPLLLR